MMKKELYVKMWMGNVCVRKIGVGWSVRKDVKRENMGRNEEVYVSVRKKVNVKKWKECVNVKVDGRVKNEKKNVKRVNMGLDERRSVMKWYMEKGSVKMLKVNMCVGKDKLG
jgi:hypothetical protein